MFERGDWLVRSLRGVVLVLVLGLVVVGFSSAAGRGVPAVRWSRIGSGAISAASQPGVVRTPDGVLHVVWVRGAAELDLLDTVVSGRGAVGKTTAIVSGWKGLVLGPSIVVDGGQLRVLFGGLDQATTASDPLFGTLATTTGGRDGVSWTAPEKANATNTFVYGAHSIGAAVTKGGVPVAVWGDSQPDRDGYHFGVGGGSDVELQQGCCLEDGQLAVDDATGQVMAAYVSIGTYASNAPGLYLQRIGPTGLLGKRVRIPGANDTAIQRPAITSREEGAGVFVAYPVGSPIATTLDLWRAGGARPAVLARGGSIRNVAAGPAPHGRIWVLWYDSAQLHAACTNASVTKIGPVVDFSGPPGMASSESPFDLTGEGSRGTLDVVATVGIGNSTQIWHTQVKPLCP
jgi:hypothetical protein